MTDSSITLKPGILSHHRKAVVTGGSSGLGLAVVRRLLEAGLDVVVVSRSRPELDHPNWEHIPVDLSDSVAIADFSQKIGVIDADLWINNAGAGAVVPWGEITIAEEEKLLRLLLTAPLALSREFLRNCRFEQERGREFCLIQVSSLAVELPIPYMSTYNVAKAGLSQHCASVALEAPFPLRVIDFRPGDFNTPFIENVRSLGKGVPKGFPERLTKHHRIGPSPDLAALALISALKKKKQGILRSGTWRQRAFYPLGKRVLPSRVLLRLIRNYYGLR